MDVLDKDLRNSEYAGKKDIFFSGFTGHAVIPCPKCKVNQKAEVYIGINDLEFKSRLLNFICKTKKCGFKSTFLFYLGMELT